MDESPNIYRYILICVAALQPTLNAWAAQCTGIAADVNTFKTPMSVSGSEPATHYGADTAASEPMRDSMTALMGGGVPAGFYYVRMDLDTGVVQSTNVSGIQAGDVIVSWFEVLQALGLQIIYPDVHPS